MYDPPKLISHRCCDSIQYCYASYRYFSPWCDFFLRCRVTFCFFSLISSIAVKSYNPLEICSRKTKGERGWREGKTKNNWENTREHKSFRLVFRASLKRLSCTMRKLYNEHSVNVYVTSFPCFFFVLPYTMQICHIQEIRENFIMEFSNISHFFFIFKN